MVERVKIYPGILEAKFDTGAKTASIDARDIETFEHKGTPWVRFRIVNRDGHGLVLERPLVRETKIQRHFDKRQRRPVVRLGVCVGDFYREVQVSLVNRYPMLIGRMFMKKRLLVDPALRFPVPPARNPISGTLRPGSGSRRAAGRSRSLCSSRAAPGGSRSSMRTSSRAASGCTTINDANRQAVWAVRRASGPQGLYYRAVVQALGPGDQEPSAPRPKIDTTRPLQGSHLAAAESLLSDVREQSADLDTLVTQLGKRLADLKPDSNVALLLGHHPDPAKRSARRRCGCCARSDARADPARDAPHAPQRRSEGHRGDRPRRRA